jgi:hypothetical protein
MSGLPMHWLAGLRVAGRGAQVCIPLQKGSTLGVTVIIHIAPPFSLMCHCQLCPGSPLI